MLIAFFAYLAVPLIPQHPPSRSLFQWHRRCESHWFSPQHSIFQLHPTFSANCQVSALSICVTINRRFPMHSLSMYICIDCPNVECILHCRLSGTVSQALTCWKDNWVESKEPRTDPANAPLSDPLLVTDDGKDEWEDLEFAYAHKPIWTLNTIT